MDLKPEWRVPPGLGLCILQAALQPFTLPVWSPFYGRQSWVVSEPGPQPSVTVSGCEEGVCSGQDRTHVRKGPRSDPSSPTHGQHTLQRPACLPGHHLVHLPNPWFGPMFTRDP